MGKFCVNAQAWSHWNIEHVVRYFTCTYSYNTTPLCSKTQRSATPRVQCWVAWCMGAESGRRGGTQADFSSVKRFISHRADHQEGMFPFKWSAFGTARSNPKHACSWLTMFRPQRDTSHLTLDRWGAGGECICMERFNESLTGPPLGTVSDCRETLSRDVLR